MTSWSISPDGVSAVLASVQTDAESFGTSLAPLGPAQDELNTGSSASAAMAASADCQPVGQFILAEVAAATAGLIGSLEPRVTAISARIQACGLGAGEATMAYVRGDEEMAASTQAAAVAAASSGDLSFFGAR